MPRTNRRVPTEPIERAGIFKRLEEVPVQYLLETRSAEYEDRDLWTEWYRDTEKADLAERTRKRINRCEKRWKAHMDERGRHHGLARPEDVEAFLEPLAEEYAMASLYNYWFARLASFYRHLWHHADHFHAYSPVVLAAIEGGVARDCWDYRQGVADKQYAEKHQ